MEHEIKSLIQQSIEVKQNLLENIYAIEWIEEIAILLTKSINDGNRIYLCGNGGSAADAQHIAAELSWRFLKDRKALPAEAIHTNSSFLTAVANDLGYDQVFARYIEAMGKPKDVLIALSTSGNSLNVIEAVKKAKSIGMTTIGITGINKSQLDQHCHHLLHIPSTSTPRIQEVTILVGHILCQLIEEHI